MLWSWLKIAREETQSPIASRLVVNRVAGKLSSVHFHVRCSISSCCISVYHGHPRREILPSSETIEMLNPANYNENLNMNPSPLWNGASTATLATVSVLCRMFLLGTQRKFELEGLEQFLQFMEERKTKPNMRGLVTGEYISILIVILEFSKYILFGVYIRIDFCYLCAFPLCPPIDTLC